MIITKKVNVDMNGFKGTLEYFGFNKEGEESLLFLGYNTIKKNFVKLLTYNRRS